jgi:VCBS repeat protein/IPT/TIG domain-containing protein
MSLFASSSKEPRSFRSQSWFRACLAICGSACVLVGCGAGSSGGTGAGGGNGGGVAGGGVGGNAPQIQRVGPSRVMTGVTIGEATLAGTNFTANSTVLFDGVSVQTMYQDPTTLQFMMPSTVWTPPASHTVQVSDSANGKSNVSKFEVYTPEAGPALFIGQATQYMAEALITNSLIPDINGDGRADLVLLATVPNSNPVQYVPVVRYGRSDGSFSESSPLVSFALSFSPGMILAGDFNDDGHTDLMLFGGGNSSPVYQVLINDGTGYFTSAGSGSLGVSSLSVPAATGDFNHDGKLDFVCSGSSSGQSFSLFLGNGDGTFATPVPIGASTGGSPAQLLDAADLNGDGYTDIVYLETYQFNNQIRTLLSSTGGAYTDTPFTQLPNGTLGFVVGDFNNDHIPDIFAVDMSGMGQAYLGAGNGTFTATGKQIVASDGYLASQPFVAGDFDHDGNIDIATRSVLSGPDEVVFLWGDGKGNFKSQGIVSDHSFTLEVGDVNGDGIPDIFATADPGHAYPSVVLGQNGRNFPSPQILFPNTLGVLSAGDVFNDGFMDLLVAGAYTGGPFNIPGNIYQFQTSGAFASQGAAPTYSTVLVDLNGDGIPDMVGFSGSEILIWQGDGTGIFQSPINQISLTRGFAQYDFRDMDKDGNMDIVLPGVILYGLGNFQFEAMTWDFYENFVVGDFDGDGIPDIATGSGILFGQGNRIFTAPMGICPMPNSAPPFPTQIVADINGDGKDDLVFADSGPVIWLSNGRQGFELDQVLIVNGYSPLVGAGAVADFNGDGRLDIAVGTISPEDVILFINDGSGKYQVTSYATGIGSKYSLAADLNHDGKADLAFLEYYIYVPPTVVVLLHK